MLKILDVFNQIKFNEPKHTYHLNNKELTPVTSFVSQYKQPFDKEYWSKRKAEEEGITQEEMLEAWKLKGIEAMNKGTEVHSYIQKRLHNEYPILPKHQEVIAFENFWLREHIQQIVIATEFKVGDFNLGLGGTVDCLFENMRQGTYRLVDWKTGKLKLDNPWQTMLPPFDDLEDCQYNHYSLQLSTYKLILKRNTGIEIPEMQIIHFDNEGGWGRYEAIDYSDRIEKLILDK